MREHVDAVLLDFDGTLVDSAPDLVAALNRVLDDLDHAPVPFERFRQHAGAGAKRLLIQAFEENGRHLGDDEAMPHVQSLIEYYRAAQTEQARPFPGVIATLEIFRDADVALAVCTNKPDASTRELLDHFGMSAFFGAVLCGDTVTAKKPDPAHLHEALDALGVRPERAVMVGDSAADVDAARDAGIASVAVAYGYSPTPATALGADAVIEDFESLPAAIRRLLA